MHVPQYCLVARSKVGSYILQQWHDCIFVSFFFLCSPWFDLSPPLWDALQYLPIWGLENLVQILESGNCPTHGRVEQAMLPIKELWNYSHRWPVLYPQQWQRRLFDFHQQNNMSVDTTATNLRRISSCCLPKKQCMVWGFSALKWRCRWCDDSLSSMKLQKSLNRKGCVCKEVGQLCLWRAACRARPDLFSVRWKQMLVLWVCPHLQACVRSLAVVQLMWGILLNSLRVSACKYWRR